MPLVVSGTTTKVQINSNIIFSIQNKKKMRTCLFAQDLWDNLKIHNRGLCLDVWHWLEMPGDRHLSVCCSVCPAGGACPDACPLHVWFPEWCTCMAGAPLSSASLPPYSILGTGPVHTLPAQQNRGRLPDLPSGVTAD